MHIHCSVKGSRDTDIQKNAIRRINYIFKYNEMETVVLNSNKKSQFY